MSQHLSISAWFFVLIRKIVFVWVKLNIIGGNREQLGITGKHPVFYILPHKSLSDRLALEQACLDSGLPSLQQAISSKSKLRSSYTYVYKRKKPMFSRRATLVLSRRLRMLVQLAVDKPEFDAQIVPASLFWGRAPDKEKSLLKLLLSDTWAIAGRLQKLLIILIHGRDTLVQFGAPLSLRRLVDDCDGNAERATHKLARILRVHFRRQRQAVLGPDLSHRRTLVNGVVMSQAVRQVIAEVAATENIPVEEARQRAYDYADEMVSNVSIATIRFLNRLLHWLWHRIYNGVTVNNVEVMRDVARDNAVVYVPCHRSHIDYLLLSYALYRNGIMPPHIAAGINLNMPIVGAILRRGGAFFMRRSFKDNRLYAAVFNEYLHTIFRRGFSVEYFVEGGRSRTGRTLQPKSGMLAMTVRSFIRDHQKPIAFMPVYFGYEKVLEARSYLGELRGAKKEKESILGIIKSLRNLRQSFGRVSLTFGEPLLLADFLDQVHPDWRNESKDPNARPEWVEAAVNELSREVVTRINSAAAINPINLVATVLLATERQAMDERMLIEHMESLCGLLRKNPYSELTQFPEGTGKEWVDYAAQMRLVYRQRQKLGDIVLLDGTNAILLTYYRNNVLHLFAIPSLIACLFENSHELKRERVEYLCGSIYPYIRSELFLRWHGDDSDEMIRQWIKTLVAEGLIVEQGDRLLRPQSRSAEFFRLRVLAKFIIPTLERYYITSAVLQRHGNGALDAKELEELSTLMAERMAILFGLNAPEFFDKSLFRNFIDTLRKHNIIREDEAGKIHFDDQLEDVSEDARLVLSAQLRQSIMQVTAGSGGRD